MQSTHPELNERAQGWLNFLYLKATTPDDWTEDGTPMNGGTKHLLPLCVHFLDLIFRNLLMQ
mgnify:CR=1 FL=1